MANSDAIKKDKILPRGDTWAFTFESADLGDLDAAYLSCKLDEDDEEYVFQKSIGDGITKVSTGKYRIRVAPEDTASLDIDTYKYDFRIVKNGDVMTIMEGSMKLTREITTIEGD